MVIYILNFISIPIYAFLIKKKKSFVFLMTLQLFLILSLRAETLGMDLLTYKNGYDYIASLSFSDFVGRLRFFQVAELKYPFAFESGYALSNWLCSLIGISFHGYLVIYAAFVSVSYGMFVYRYSAIPWLSYALFFSLSFFEYSFGILRQTIAACILLYSIKFLINKKHIFYFALVFLAFLFHRISVLWVFLWIFSKLNLSKTRYLGICSFGMFSVVLSPFLYEYIITPILLFLGKNRYVENEFALNNFFILIVVIAVFLYFTLNFKNQNAVIHYSLLIFLLLLAIEIIGLNQPVFARARVIPLCSLLVLIPNVFANYKDKKLVFITKIVAYCGLFGFMVFQLSDSVIVPYVPYWKVI